MGEKPDLKPDFRTATWNQTGTTSWSMNSPYYINPIQQLAAAQASAEYWKRQALTDELTQVPNRKALNHDLKASDHGRRNISARSILVIDLDNFKYINDTHGHAAGDSVLQEVAQRLVDRLRTNDKVYRVGGDEFICLLEGATVEDTNQTVARDLEQLLGDGIPVRLDSGQTITARGSVGIFHWDKDLDQKDNFIEADRAMFIVKQQRELAGLRHQRDAVPTPAPAVTLPGAQPT